MAYRKTYSGNRYSSSGYSRRSYGGSARMRSYTRSRPAYKKSYRSRGLQTRTVNGYAQYKDPHTGSWKFTHRRVAEKKLGGRIRRGFEVHHINGVKKDNRPSNLRVLSKSKHRALHRRLRWFKKRK